MRTVKFLKKFATRKKNEIVILGDFVASDLVKRKVAEYHVVKQNKK